MKTYPTRLDMIAALPPGSGVEVGVQRGVFSREILANTKTKRLVLVDAWCNLSANNPADPANLNDGGHEANLRHVQAEFAAEIESMRVVLVRMPSTEAVQLFNDRTFDWAFIDAAHDYASVMADLVAWAPKIRKGGVLMGHDYVSNEKSMGMGFAVIEAVGDFCRSHGWRLTAVTEEEWPSFQLERV